MKAEIFSHTRFRLVIVISIAILARLLWYLADRQSPLFLYPVIDEKEFLEVASNIASKNFIYDQHFLHPPLYYYFLAFFLKLGFGFKSILVFQCVLGISGTAILYKVLSKSHEKTAFWTAVIWALYPVELFTESRFLSENLFTFLVIILFWLLTSEKNILKFYLLSGIITGLAIITKTQFILFGLVWLIILVFKEKSMMRNIAAYGLSMLIIPILVSLHNYHYSDQHLIFVSANGPMNLYIGNSADIEKTLNIRPSEWKSKFFPSLYKEAKVDIPDDSSSKDKLYTYLLSGHLIKKTFRENSNPLVPIRNLLQKAFITLHSYETPRNYDLYEYRRWNKYLLFTTSANSLYLPLAIFFYAAVLYIILKWRKVVNNRVYLLAILIVASVLLPSILFFNAFRYRLTAVPFLLFFAIHFYTDYFKNLKIQAVHLVLILVFGSGLTSVFLIQKIPLSESYTTYGNAFLAKNKINQAERFYHRAVQAAQNESVDADKARFQLGSMALQRGDKQSALEYFSAINEKSRLTASALINQAVIYYAAQKYDLAYHSYRKASMIFNEADETRALAFYGKAMSLIKSGNSQKAISDLDSAVKINPQYSDALIARAKIFGQSGDYVKSLRDFDAALKLKPNNVRILTDRAIACMNAGDFRGAISDIAIALKKDNSFGEAYYIRGLCNLELNRMDTACHDFYLARKYGFKAADEEIKNYCQGK